MNYELFKEVLKEEDFQNYQFKNGAWVKGKVYRDQGYAENFGIQWNKF